MSRFLTLDRYVYFIWIHTHIKFTSHKMPRPQFEPATIYDIIINAGGSSLLVLTSTSLESQADTAPTHSSSLIPNHPGGISI